jgi:hypothetical protein
MATRKPVSAPPQSPNLSAEQMRAAIPKLERRIKDLEDFDPRTIASRSDPKLNALDTKLLDAISDVFGSGTLEYHRFHLVRLTARDIALAHRSHCQKSSKAYSRAKSGK